MEKLKKTKSATFGGGVSILEKDVIDLIEMKKPVPSKVMDVLIKFSWHLLRSDDVDGRKLRVEVFDSKFVSQLSCLYAKFKLHANPCDFKFPESIVAIVEGVGDSDRVALFSEAEFVYMPFNFDKKHWVVLCLDLPAAKLSVLDCNIQLRPLGSIISELEPIATMLPFLFGQVAANPSLRLVAAQPYTLERVTGIPQVSSSAESGVMAISLIHAHAAGGVEECYEIDMTMLGEEAKKLVSAIIQADFD